MSVTKTAPDGSAVEARLENQRYERSRDGRKQLVADVVGFVDGVEVARNEGGFQHRIGAEGVELTKTKVQERADKRNEAMANRLVEERKFESNIDPTTIQ